MNKEIIFKRLDGMLANDKSKSFLNHLIRNYLPVTKAQKVFDKPKGPFKCVITNVDLVSLNEILEGIHSETFKTDFMAHIKEIFTPDAETRINPISLLVGEKKLAITGKNTTTYMSINTFQTFYDWVVTKMLSGDKYINWLLSSVNKNPFLKRAETIDDDGVQETVKAINKRKNGTSMISTFTLGEIPALAKLKEKFND